MTRTCCPRVKLVWYQGFLESLPCLKEWTKYNKTVAGLCQMMITKSNYDKISVKWWFQNRTITKSVSNDDSNIFPSRKAHWPLLVCLLPTLPACQHRPVLQQNWKRCPATSPQNPVGDRTDGFTMARFVGCSVRANKCHHSEIATGQQIEIEPTHDQMNGIHNPMLG